MMHVENNMLNIGFDKNYVHFNTQETRTIVQFGNFRMKKFPIIKKFSDLIVFQGRIPGFAQTAHRSGLIASFTLNSCACESVG